MRARNVPPIRKQTARRESYGKDAGREAERGRPGRRSRSVGRGRPDDTSTPKRTPRRTEGRGQPRPTTEAESCEQRPLAARKFWQRPPPRLLPSCCSSKQLLQEEEEKKNPFPGTIKTIYRRFLANLRSKNTRKFAR